MHKQSVTSRQDAPTHELSQNTKMQKKRIGSLQGTMVLTHKFPIKSNGNFRQLPQRPTQCRKFLNNATGYACKPPPVTRCFWNDQRQYPRGHHVGHGGCKGRNPETNTSYVIIRPKLHLLLEKLWVERRTQWFPWACATLFRHIFGCFGKSTCM